MYIRPFTESDFGVVRAWFPTEPALIQWGGPDIRFPLTDLQLAEMHREGDGQRPNRWLLSGVMGASIVAHSQVALDWRHGVARLSRVAINPDFRGRGLAILFLEKIIALIFDRSEFVRIELNVYTFNTAAIKTYRKLGFAEEGVRRSAVKVGMERRDTAMFGLLRAPNESRNKI
jgi:RimJ/RimL family protein N-acetyltransferase